MRKVLLQRKGRWVLWAALVPLTASCGEGVLRGGMRSVDAGAGDGADLSDGTIQDAAADAPVPLRPPGDRDAETPPQPDGATMEIDAAAPPPPPPDPADAATPPPPAPDAAPPPPPAPVGPPVYPADRDQSPLTPALADRLRAWLQGDSHANVFAKIGDSITVASSFLHCFDGANVDFADDPRAAQLSETVDFFRAGDAAGASPFDRESAAAVVGWSVQSALRGAPSPVDLEVNTLGPQIAVVMFGSNDIQNDNLPFYGDHMRALVDGLLARGVLPILSTVPPRDDSGTADAEVPTYNTVLRALAQSRGVPLIDLNRRLLPLPSHGLGPDHLHPRAYSTAAGSRPCVFTAEGLQNGYNVRNLLTIQALDRLRRVLAGEPAPDDAGPVRLGAGTAADPIQIEALPFGDVRDTRTPAQNIIAAYPGCRSAADEGGGEFVYRLDLAAPTTIRADLVDGDGVDIDLHLVVDPNDGNTCLQRHDREIVADLAPGTWYLVADTYVAAGAPQPGEFLLAIVAQ